ncbi:MAG TPA: thioredoxin domain-containing protein [Nitrospirota bacterium]|nr:thioredoxin domain-containing protein [Nitrospirota bacterium]
MEVSSTLKKIMISYDGKVRLVIKNVPYGYRQYSVASALAALAAGDQGKYWEMHDLLFARWPQLDPESLVRYARELGLDLERFKQSMDSKLHKDAIERDLKLGDELHVYMTPTFFINGRKFVGEMRYREFEKIIEEEVKNAK